MLSSFRARLVAGIGCLGCLGYLMFFAVFVSLTSALAPAPASKPVTMAAAPTTLPVVTQPTAAPPPTEVPPTAAPPTAAPKPAVVAKPAPPTATAKPAGPSPLVVDFTGEFEPKLLRVGQKLVVKLGIENKSERPIEGLRIFSSGPWGKFTVASVLPGGRLESGLLGFNIYSPMTVPPGQTRFINIVAYPNEPGNHEFSFIPNRDTEALKGADGQGIVIGGTVAVIR